MPVHEAKEYSAHTAKPRHEMTAIPAMNFVAEPLSDFNVGHDKRGSFIGGNSAHNTAEPHLDIRDEVKHDLMATVAEKLNLACTKKAFDKLILVAPPRILNELKKHLHPDTARCVISEVAKDYSHDQNEALLAHLQNTLADAHIG